MAHFAELDDNNTVVQVIVVDNSDIQDLPFPASEQVGISYLNSIGIYGNFKQTSYNNNFRGSYATVDGVYNENYDVFVRPQPFPSWSLNEQNTEWLPPTPMPDDGGNYYWNEQNQSWVGY